MFTQHGTMAWIYVFMLVAVAGQMGKGNVASNLIQNLAQANQNFSVSMYHLLKVNNPNLIFSPHSVHTALTMTYMGATQLTEEEMMQVLGLKKLKQNAHQAYAILIQSLQQASSVTLNLANGVFVNPKFPIKNEFKTGLSNFYQAGFDQFRFDAPGGPEAPINQWVSNMTAGKIPSLLESNYIEPLTAMLILNAISFKGKWRKTFDPKITKEDDFFVTKDIKVKVPMMYRKGRHNYTESNDLKAHILAIPYTDTRYSMFFVLPTKRNDLDSVEEHLNTATLTSALDSLDSWPMEAYIPKFKVESGLKLKETLIQMGMVKAFGDEATFGRISSLSDLFISDAIHKAVISVTETGTEAAGVASAQISERSMPTEFRADHPFIYFIRDNVNQVLLFLGKYSETTSTIFAEVLCVRVYFLNLLNCAHKKKIYLQTDPRHYCFGKDSVCCDHCRGTVSCKPTVIILKQLLSLTIFILVWKNRYPI